MTREQGERVRGVTSPGHALDPFQISEDEFILPLDVLDDPAHAVHIPFLSTLREAKILVSEVTNQISLVKNSICLPTRSPRTYSPRGDPWNQPPKPQKGDWSEERLYASVGRALSQWERFEVALSDLFSALLDATDPMLASRAYGSVVSCQGRIGMVNEAAAAYFVLNNDIGLEGRVRATTLSAERYSSRRNEIAHGMVAPYSAPDGPTRGLALLPPRYATKRLKLVSSGSTSARPSEVPRYAYASPEISFFAERFLELVNPTSSLARDIRAAWRRGKKPKPNPLS